MKPAAAPIPAASKEPAMTAAAAATVPLTRPITVNDQPVATLSLREPATGELRGVQLSQLLAGDQVSVARVLSRICTPPLTEAQIGTLAVRDFTAAYAALAGFFVGDDTPTA